MTIGRVDTFDDFWSLQADWNALYHADPEAQFFLSWQWLAGALERHPGEWIVLVARDTDGRCLGILPLRQKTIWSTSRKRLRNELHFAGRLFWADYGGILCLPGEEDAVLRALALHLKQMHWSHIYLKGFRISDRRYALFMEPFADERLTVESLTSTINEHATNNLICPYIDLPDTFDAYLSDRLSSNTRQKLRRLLRKVESSPEYRITMTQPDTQSRDVQILQDLWSQMWRWLKGSDTERLAAKYGMIVTRGLDEDMVMMPVLWHGDTPVGVLASFVDWHKSRLLFFVSGRDEQFRDLPVGLLLHAHNIRWAIENGIETYDLLRGNEPYKYSLGAADARVKYPLIRTRSGTNLNGVLDPGCVNIAFRVANELVRRERASDGVTVCRQILAAVPGHAAAAQLLNALTDARSTSPV